MNFLGTTITFCLVFFTAVVVVCCGQQLVGDVALTSALIGDEDETTLTETSVQVNSEISMEYSSGGIDHETGLSEESEVESGEVNEEKRFFQSSQEEGEVHSLESGDSTSSQDSESVSTSPVNSENEKQMDPTGRRLPPVRAPDFQRQPPFPDVHQTTVVNVIGEPVVVGHSVDRSEELQVHVASYDQQQRIDSNQHQESTTTIPVSMEAPLSNVATENHIELPQEQSTLQPVTQVSSDSVTNQSVNIVVISSVQTSKSTEEGELLYSSSNESDSGEEYSDESKEKELSTTTAKPETKIIQAVVTSKSVIETNLNDVKETEPTPDLVTMIIYKSEVETKNITQQTSPGDTTVPTTTTSSPIPEIVPTNNVITFSTTTDANTMSILSENQPKVTLVEPTSTTTSTKILKSEVPIGKSLKSLFEQQHIMTEDPSVLAKLLPPSTPSIKPVDKTENQEKENKMTKTIVDKGSGKTFTLKLLTEDPSVLAAMTPPPRNVTTTTTEAQVKVIFDKASGKNVTIRLMTEDPSVLAAMTPSPRGKDNVTSPAENITSSLAESPTTKPTTPKLAHYPGVPQQFGKLPIATRHNVTRKPFLRARSSTKNPRPGPVIKKMSDIVNRSRIAATKRPYFIKQSHEGEYQQDPEKKILAGATTSTTEKPTTTLSPYFRWGKSILISSNLKLIDGADWSEELRDSTTLKFKKLSNEIAGELDKIFRHSPSIANKYKGVQIDSFSKGSVLVDYTLFLKEDTRGKIADILRNSFREGLGNKTFLGTFKVDPLYANFKVITPEIISAPPSSEDVQGFPHWAVAIVGSGIAAIVFLIVLFTIRKCSSRAARRKYGAPLTNDSQERKPAEKLTYDNPVAEGIYDLDNVWNEKKQRPRTNSSSASQSNSAKNMQQIYAASSQGSKRSEENPYYSTKLFRRDSFGKNPYAYNPNGVHQSSNYDAWNEWEDFYEIKQDRRYHRDYDTTF